MPVTETRRQLLVVWHSLGGSTRALVQALCEGARGQEPAVVVRCLHASRATAADVLGCDALVLATPETLGSISGQMKDFLDRSYYALRGQRPGLPVTLMVVAGTDGAPTVQQLRRVVAGLGWREVSSAVHWVTGVTPDQSAVRLPSPGPWVQARETGATLAAGLALGIH